MPIAEVSLACPGTALLDQFLRDELPDEEAARVESHVNSCAPCQRLLSELVGHPPHSEVAGVARADGAVPDPKTVAHASTGLDFLLAIQAGASSEPPPRLEGYPLLGRLGAGGMGVVWRVHDLEFGRDLALKVMKRRLCGVRDLEQRFLNEAHICGRLTHPSIVPVHALGWLDDGRPYYLMKLVSGQTLASLLRTRVSPADGLLDYLRVFSHVCEAMAFAHSQGVIHRDLKPANVMVGAHEEVQLLDWGLAKVLTEQCPATSTAVELPDGTTIGEAHEATPLTEAGSMLGTFAYAAPEQARGLVAEVDRRSDVFGLGTILCEILTGEPPYIDSEDVSLRQQATAADLQGAVARLRDCGADAALVDLAVRCLAPQKSDRPADAGEVAAAIAAYLEEVEERSRQAACDLAAENRLIAPIARFWRRCRQRPLVCSLTTALAVAAVIVVTVAFRPTPKLRVGIWPWVGYSPLAVADELSLCAGIDLELVPVADLQEARNRMLAGEIDASACIVDGHVHTRAQGVPAKAVLKLDESRGADALVVRPEITSFDQLKGKRIAYADREAPHFLLLSLCELHQFKQDDFVSVATSAQEAAEKFIRGEVDAAVTYDPYLRDALKHGHRLASSADVPGEIVDILTISESYLTAHPERVQALIEGWFAAVENLEARRPEAIEIACKFLGPGVTATDYFAMAREMTYSGRNDNLEFFRVTNGRSRFRDLMSNAQDRWQKFHQLGQRTQPQDGDGSAVLFEVHGRARSR